LKKLLLLVMIGVGISVASWTAVQSTSRALAKMIYTDPVVASAPPTGVSNSSLKWEYTTLFDFPAVVMDDDKAAVGFISGKFNPEHKTDFWVFYTEQTDDPFLLVSIAVDGEIIVVCEENGAVCEYRPNKDAGGSILSLNKKHIEAIQNGQTLDLVLFVGGEFVRTQRSLEGFGQQASKLSVTTITPEQTEQDDVTVPPWKLYETKDPTLGHVVLIHGPVEEGEVTLSWSSAGYLEQIVPIENYSGSEVFFKPTTGTIFRLEDVYWDHKGKRTDIVIAEMCKTEDKKICVFRGGVSIVMTEQDLTMMQIGRTLVIKWSDEAGNSHTSKVLLGQKSYSFNTRIQELMKKDAVGLQSPTHASA
jgi:hypothetical protein